MTAQQRYPFWPTDFPVGLPDKFDYEREDVGPQGTDDRCRAGACAASSQRPAGRDDMTCPPSYFGDVCPTVAQCAGKAALRAVQRMTRESVIFHGRQGLGDGVALVERSDVIVGRMLGRGGFSEVCEARLVSSSSSSLSRPDGDDAFGDDGMVPTEANEKGAAAGGRAYAVKFLRGSVMANKKKFERGAADLAIEAKLLSAFDHPHIIRLHGITAGSVAENIARGRECSFFLLLDRLYETLDERIEGWKQAWSKSSGLFYRATHDFRGCKRRALVAERLRVALDLAYAVAYLHENSVAYRDIKPENVGFDARGVLKLFDFGLAIELKPSRRCIDGTYQLTGNTGSRRYMAPEVAKAQPYNLSVDSYSFGMLLWEMLALEKPFHGFSEVKHMQLVVEGGQRPKIDRFGAHSHWPKEAQSLIEMCWRVNLHERPDFGTIINVLKCCIDDDAYKCKRSCPIGMNGSSKLGGAKRIGSFSNQAEEVS